jgi:hypothetical protein
MVHKGFIRLMTGALMVFAAVAGSENNSDGLPFRILLGVVGIVLVLWGAVAAEKDRQNIDYH